MHEILSKYKNADEYTVYGYMGFLGNWNTSNFSSGPANWF